MFRNKKLYKKYRNSTMIPFETYCENIELINRFKSVKGCIVECGVWRGGMSATMVEILGLDRKYYLFDSFEGLPQAKEVDGVEAIKWQNDKTSEFYYNNCKAEENEARETMKMSGAKNFELIKGFFCDTLPGFKPETPIAILRLDGDWYESTMDCLKYLFPLVERNGLILIDDYYLWDGCSKAVHDYLSKNSSSARIKQFNNGNLHYIVKP